MDFERLINQFGLSVDQTQSINPVVLSICVQVDHQRTRRLDVHRYDDPFIVSSKFCKEHSLSPSQRDTIQQEITNHLQLQQSKHTADNHSNIRISEDGEELKTATVKGGKWKEGSSKISGGSGRAIGGGVVRGGKRKSSGGKRNGSGSKRNGSGGSGSRVGNGRLSVSSSYLMKQRGIVQKVQKENQKEMRQCTFKPKINVVSAILATNRTPSKPSKTKAFQQQHRKQLQQQQQCTFKPQLNEKSRVMAIRDTKQESVYSQLYRKGLSQIQHQRSRAMQVDQECTFKPQINQFSMPQHKECRFTYRIEQENCSFNPKINKINVPYNPSGIEKWTYLQRKQNKSRIVQKPPQIQLSQKDQKIFQQLIGKIAASFFLRLDSDGDGYVTANDMDLQNLPVDILKLSKQFLQQIQDLNLKVDLTLFTNAFRQFFVRQDLISRHVFMKMVKKEPTSSYRSGEGRRMVAHQRDRILVDKYEQGVARLKAKQEAQASAVSRRRMEQLKQCTFKPLISQSMWYDDYTQ